MIRKAMILPAGFAGLLLCVQPGVAKTFGDLYVGKEARSSVASFLDDPAIAKWLMTLPQTEEAVQTAEANSIRTELFDPDPIGGEVYQLAALVPPAPPEATTEASLSEAALDDHPIGGETYKLARFLAPFALAQNAAQNGRPALEGRSAAVPKRARAKTAARAHAHVTAARAHQVCSCALAARVR